MTRETSIEAYREALAGGLINRQHSEILALVLKRGPATSAETVQDTVLAKNLNLTRARFTELHQVGWLKSLEPRHCRITGHRATVWDLGIGAGPSADEKFTDVILSTLKVLKRLDKACITYLGNSQLSRGRRAAINRVVASAKTLEAILGQVI